ncbi:MAG: pyrimidine dimer DNA glycosylase/endonuclease V [Actinobacteria bacterium]|nr:pyrimidine dimer DNA glycosylase/endonuclease V [Actinomycetota bacterium]MCA1806551.1 pyrimidine dimer DNA glycosylase/endonuclease V [Actinomycetota bacterium]
MRANVGVPPSILTDQHLIAEYRELLIPGGWQRKREWGVGKTPIPPSFRMGKGHITFWRDKHLYLARRHTVLIAEMKSRGFKPNYVYWDLDEIPEHLKNDWAATPRESEIIRDRIFSRIMDKPSWYRFMGKPLGDVEEYKRILYGAEVFM